MHVMRDIVRDTQLPTIFDIGRIEVRITSQTFIVYHIRQGRTIWIEHRIIHRMLHTQILYG